MYHGVEMWLVKIKPKIHYSDSSGYSYFVQSNRKSYHRLFPLNDQQKTVEACARLLANEKLRKEMGAVAKEEAVQKYDIKDWENRILAFYEHALHKSNGGSS